MTEISIIGAKDEVDAEETLIKAAKDIQKDLEKETEFEEPYLKSIDDELTDIILLIKKQMIHDIVDALYRK